MRLADIAQTIAQTSAARYLEKRGWALPLGVGVGLGVPSTLHEMEKQYHDTRKKLDQATLQKIWPGATKMGAAPPPWQQDPALIAAMRARYGGGGGGGSGGGGRSSGNPGSNPSPGSNQPFGPKSPPSQNTPPTMPLEDIFMQALSKHKMDPRYLGPSIYPHGASMLGSALNKMVSPIIEAPGKAIAGYIERAMGPAQQFGESQDIPHMLGTKAIQSFGSEIGLSGAKLLTDMASKAMSAVGNIGNESARTAILQQLRQEDPVLRDADDKELMEAYHTMTRFAPTLSTDKNAVRSFLRQAAISGTGLDFMTIKLLADSERAVTGKEEKR